MSAVMTTSAVERQQSVLRLTVNNHPGVMSHICGLFSRRSYNLEGIMVRPIQGTDGAKSRVWLLLNEVDKLEQVIRQTEKMVDVLQVEHHEFAKSVFASTDGFFTE
ncbi:MAG: ACT domain-containing protein [Leucothrix sp.]